MSPSATGVGFGAPASGQTHPAVFIIGTVAGQYGFYRSDDGAGASWTRINDDSHQFGSLQGNYIGGDETHFGRVFLTTGGRGYIYGDRESEDQAGDLADQFLDVAVLEQGLGGAVRGGLIMARPTSSVVMADFPDTSLTIGKSGCDRVEDAIEARA